MKIVTIKDVEGFQTLEGIIKPVLFTDKLALLSVELPEKPAGEPHSHPIDCIMYCIEGEAEVTSGDKTAVISTGSVIFIPANEVAGFKNLSDKPARVLHISMPPVVESEEKYKERLKSHQDSIRNNKD